MHARSVRGILAGTKTQTRRIVKQTPIVVGPNWSLWYYKKGDCQINAKQLARLCCPYGKTGDRLWVREAFSELESVDFFSPAVPDEVSNYWYWADGNPVWGDWTRPKPSIHMPRKASRLTLEITDIRVERVQEISSDDAIAEGLINQYRDGREIVWANDQFAALWDETNGPGAWVRNDWVWVVSFRRIA